MQFYLDDFFIEKTWHHLYWWHKVLNYLVSYWKNYFLFPLMVY